MYLAVCRSGAEPGPWPGEKYLRNADKRINPPQQSTKYGTILFRDQRSLTGEKDRDLLRSTDHLLNDHLARRRPPPPY